MNDTGIVLILSLITFLWLLVVYTKQERLIREVKKAIKLINEMAGDVKSLKA